MLSSIFEQFVKESPVSVMAQALMSHIFASERMDELFRRHAQVQYQQDLLFSSLVEMITLGGVWNPEISSCSVQSEGREFTALPAIMQYSFPLAPLLS
ncbi:MAG: hypothetical protein V7K67_19305 [Nostoc sp.]|uniref:hypothetical protein n=1 Tax=Nostoc sp. TaxID=1180 RepID=UPI002FF3CC84